MSISSAEPRLIKKYIVKTVPIAGITLYAQLVKSFNNLSSPVANWLLAILLAYILFKNTKK